MDDGLVLMYKTIKGVYGKNSLNPCCSGRWSSTEFCDMISDLLKFVLILVVVDDGLVPLTKVSILWWHLVS